MFFSVKLLPLAVAVFLLIRTTSADAVRRESIVQPPGLEHLQLGNFGPISRLPTHPAFAHLGLTPQQSVGFTNILLENGYLNPSSLRLSNGQPIPQPFSGGQPMLHASSFGPPYGIDPYFLLLLSNYAKYLPYGLGPQGIYGSTGLPKTKPLGVFKHYGKN